MFARDKSPVKYCRFSGLLSTPALGVLLFFVVLQSNTAYADLRSNITSWQRAFDVVPQDQVYVARTQNIFKRLKAVVGSSVLLSELFILDSDNLPWAIALEDGNIVLSRGALDIIYGASGASLDAKDAWMAFVLGHELKHIAKKDFWHEQVYKGFVNKSIDADSDLSSVDAGRRRESELRADEDGFIYASLAGFDTRELFTSVDSESDFLHYWVNQTKTTSVSKNFSARQRVEFLAQTMASLDDAVKYFQFGTRLAYFGDYQNAIVLLNEFYKIYPSHQVLNNLGFVYLQLARQEMPVELAYQFWFPLTLVLQSGSPNIHRSLELKIPEASRKYLEYAVHLLKEIESVNSADTASVKNLAIAYIYLEEYSNAVSVLERAIRLSPDDYQLVSLMAIASVKRSVPNKNDEKTNAINLLVTEASRSEAPIDLLYNTARLMELVGNETEAGRYWSRLKPKSYGIPLVYRDLMCTQLLRFDVCSKEAGEYSAMPIAWMPKNTTGLTVGSSLDNKVVRKTLKSWGQPVVENLSSIEATIYQHDNGNSLLVIDRTISVINQKRHGFDFKEHLVQVHAQESAVPLLQFQLGSENLISNGSRWAANVRGENVEEIWFAR